MKRTLFRKVVAFILSVTLLLGALTIPAFAGELKGDESTASTLEEMQAVAGTSPYADYIKDYADYVNGDLDVIELDVLSSIGDATLVSESNECLTSRENNPGYWDNFDWAENSSKSVYLPAINPVTKKAGSVTWNFKVTKEQQGLYYLQIEYYACQTSESSVSSIERKLKIDGKIPYDEVSSITLDKHWSYSNVTVGEPVPAPADAELGTVITHDWVKKDNDKTGEKAGSYKYVVETYLDENGQKMQVTTTYKISQDINGNSMAPEAVQTSEWSTYICHDTTGYYDGYFNFFISEGEHQLTLSAEREPVVIKSIKLVPATGTSSASIPSYDEYVKGLEGKENAKGGVLTLEAEFPDYVSDSSVAPSNNNSSAVNTPISSAAQIYNVIGETSYSTVGQWAAYKFTVSESGIYNLAMRYKQEALQGMFICRAIKLSGGEYGLADGSATAPFLEAYNTRFNYSKEWQSETLGDYLYTDANGNVVDLVDFKINEDGEYVDKDGNEVEINSVKREFEFYFEAGEEYTLYLECSLGDLKDYIKRVETSLNNINACYLKILQRTGASPDKNQTYDFRLVMPEVLVTLLEEAIELTAVADQLELLCGTNGAHIATLDTVARVLDTMGSNDGIDIAANMSSLKTYLGTLGTWINDSKRGALMVDSISIVPADTEADLPKAKANFFESLWFEISSFIYSFFTEYDQMGLTSLPDENTETIDVWLASGRDQSSIWRSMIDASDGYTNRTGNAATLKLVTGGTLLPSILSGKGPDVYLGLGSADVINYAIRDAVMGVSGNAANLNTDQNAVFSSYVYQKADGELVYSDEILTGADADGLTLVSNKFGYEFVYKDQAGVEYVYNYQLSPMEVAQRDLKLMSYDNFSPAAMKTLTLCGVTYGIPMTMGFAMMFYRMDVLAKLGLEVPESWDELLAALPTLQTNNMSMGVSYVSALDFMMYQMGGSMWKYTDETLYDSTYAGAKIDLDSPIALEAFEFVCRLYTDYSFPISYDAANRFRTGEMPIVIGDYASIYNTLVVYATEIDGLWEFSSLPGSYEKATGRFNYDSLAGVTATVILNGCDSLLPAWQFVQWQTGANVQSNYGNRMVALIGPSAKYESANLDAINNLSWTANEKAAIMNQMEHMDAIVNYPGSYIIARYMKFAFLDCYNDGANPHDAMMSYIDAINLELRRKREEFKDYNLEVVLPGEDAPMLDSANPIYN